LNKKLQFAFFQKNFTVLLILITELLFTVTPNAVYLATNNAVIPLLQLRVISIIGIGHSTDIAFSTIIYWTTWYRVICPVKIQISVTILNQNPNQMATSGASDF
jgi:hypothetical protein